MGNEVVVQRFMERKIIKTDISRKNKVMKKLLKEGYSITQMEFVKRGRFKTDENRIKFIAEKEVTKLDVQDGMKGI